MAKAIVSISLHTVVYYLYIQAGSAPTSECDRSILPFFQQVELGGLPSLMHAKNVYVTPLFAKSVGCNESVPTMPCLSLLW